MENQKAEFGVKTTEKYYLFLNCRKLQNRTEYYFIWEKAQVIVHDIGVNTFST